MVAAAHAREHWVREHAGEFDLMHVHFGFDATSPESLAELVGALRAEPSRWC